MGRFGPRGCATAGALEQGERRGGGHVERGHPAPHRDREAVVGEPADAVTEPLLFAADD
jgi:hypothetical protein